MIIVNVINLHCFSPSSQMILILLSFFLFFQQPTVDNEYGTKNNVVQVRSSDFDVLHALEHDQASSRRRSNSSESSEVCFYFILKNCVFCFVKHIKC
ncbi:unnamed protein product [Schistosoma curassoni]|uniref:Secreted protein n=1 Tax=Schistosoma curassoni TaxID=6186 RepID=A0A183KU66_9TREM|nr:unnamed protein product [Schistosoma curassoni]